jgi:hypothetical protein
LDFLLLLVPGVVMSGFVLNYDSDLKDSIALYFRTLCLWPLLHIVYTYRRKVSLERMNNILLCVVNYKLRCLLVIIHTQCRDVITGTNSLLETSGFWTQSGSYLSRFMFIFFSHYFESKRILVVINLIIALNISFRGIVTFF